MLKLQDNFKFDFVIKNFCHSVLVSIKKIACDDFFDS